MKQNDNIRTDLMNPNKLNDAIGKDSVMEGELTIAPKDILTSYIFSTSSRSLSKYGERLLMEVISVAQEYTIDAALGINKLNFGEKYTEKFAIIDIPVKNLLNADDASNYTKAKEAAVELMKIYHTVEAPVYDEYGNQKTYSDGSPQYQFASFHLLDNVTINQKPGIVSVKLGAETWSQILDMGKGYTRYNLLTAKSLDNVVAIRLFQLMSNTSIPLYFSLERIKGILGLSDKYVNNTPGFIRRVILPAEEEIRQKCPFEVQHTLSYEGSGGKGRHAVVGITFEKVSKKSTFREPVQELGPVVTNMLIKNFGFDERGIRSNLKLFTAVRDAGEDLASFLQSIDKMAHKANSAQAYVIVCLRNLLEGKQKPLRAVDEIKEPAVKSSQAAAQEQKRTRAKGRITVGEGKSYKNSGLEEL